VVMSSSSMPDDYDGGNVNGPRPATAATGAVALPGCVNGGTTDCPYSSAATMS